MYYPSGVNKTAIAIQQRDRYGGITFTLVSGSTNLYIQASEYFADPNPAFISGPYTVSGEGGTNLINASYLSDTPENPENYWINLPNPGTYKVVFPNPVISTAISVTHSGSSPYVLSQMLPRKSVGSYDIDVNSIRAYHVTASFIDAVAIQVSDSIVVGPDLIGAKSIDGSKIIDGTISGVLIRDGTVTGNKVLAGTISGVLLQAETITATHIAVSGITANRLNVTQLDAVAANMGTLVVNSGISVGTNGYITVPSGYISAGKAKLDNTGLSIGDFNTALENTNALRVVGSGESANIVGMALYNGSFSPTIPQAVIQLDGTNALEVENNQTNGLINFNFNQNPAGSSSLRIYNGDLHLAPFRPSYPGTFFPGVVRGYNSAGAQLYALDHESYRTYYADGAVKHILAADRLVSYYNDGSTRFSLGDGGLEIWNPAVSTVSAVGQIDADGNLFAESATVFGNLGAVGDLSIDGGVGIGTDNDKVTIAASTGNTAIAGTLEVTNKITSSYMGYITARRTADVAITTAGTTIVWNNALRSNKITVPTNSSTITITNAGYYMFSATFATLANLTSLRMTLTRGGANYVSTLHGAGLGTGGGYIFNFNIGFFASANSTYTVVLTPSANTTLNANGEGFAGPSPLMNIFQAIGV